MYSDVTFMGLYSDPVTEISVYFVSLVIKNCIFRDISKFRNHLLTFYCYIFRNIKVYNDAIRLIPMSEHKVHKGSTKS